MRCIPVIIDWVEAVVSYDWVESIRYIGHSKLCKMYQTDREGKGGSTISTMKVFFLWSVWWCMQAHHLSLKNIVTWSKDLTWPSVNLLLQCSTQLRSWSINKYNYMSFHCWHSDECVTVMGCFETRELLNQLKFTYLRPILFLRRLFWISLPMHEISILIVCSRWV